MALNGLFVLACLYTVYFAGPFLRPMTVTLLLYFLLMPVVRILTRVKVPQWMAAAMVVVMLMGSLAVGIYALWRPAAAWAARAPESLARIEQRLSRLTQRFENVTRTADRVEKIASGGGPAVPQVEIKEQGWGEFALGQVVSFTNAFVIVSALLYFLLAYGDLFLKRIIKVLPRLGDKIRAVTIARDMESQISSYLLSTTIDNAILGGATALAMYLLGMPSPVLWGAVAGVTNYVPVLGGLFTTVVLGLAALLAFPDPTRAMTAPLAFLALNVIESNFLYPLIVGRRMTLNPVMVLVSVTFWAWAWGLLGALVAVPILAAFKICCQNIEGLQPVADFLDDKPEEEGHLPAAVETPARSRE